MNIAICTYNYVILSWKTFFLIFFIISISREMGVVGIELEIFVLGGPLFEMFSRYIRT